MAAIVSPIGILNAVASHGDFDVTRDLAYAAGSRHRLDVYEPRSRRAPAPVVVFFYGGGWEEGDRANYLFVGSALAARGFVTIIPDYRVYPEVRFPGFVQDGALAVGWARDHAAEFGGDASRIVLMGHSAGAHIAAMLTFDRQWLAAVRLEPSRDLKGLIGLAGPYDFLPLHSDTLKTIFGPEDRLAETQPIHFVDGTAPPAFLATGRSDKTVDPGNASRLAGRIRQSGGRAQVKIYDFVNHATILGAVAAPLRFLAPVLKDTRTFIDRITAETSSDAGLVLSGEGL